MVLLATTAQAKTKGAKATTVTLSGWSAGADEDNLLQQVVNTFMKSHPSIKVDYSVINGDYSIHWLEKHLKAQEEAANA